MAPKLKDIASAAGVSTMTASRALRGVGRVNDETRRRVREVAKQLGGVRYSGVVMSRVLHQSMAESRMRLLIPELTGGRKVTDSVYGRYFLRGLNEHLSQRGGVAHVCEVRHLEELFGLMDKHRTHGVVLRQAWPHAWVDSLLKHGPVVYALAHDFQLQTDTVYSNEHRSAVLIAQHLAQLGHRDLVWLGILDENPAQHLIHEAFTSSDVGDRQSTTSHAVRFAAWANLCYCQHVKYRHPMLLLQRDWRYQSMEDVVENAVVQLLALRPQPTAVITPSSNIGFALIQSLEARGLRIPQDMSVVSYGVNEEQQGLPKRLTLIDVPMERIGQVVPELIERRLANPDAVAVSMQIEAALVIGQTTCPAPR